MLHSPARRRVSYARRPSRKAVLNKASPLAHGLELWFPCNEGVGQSFFDGVRQYKADFFGFARFDIREEGVVSRFSSAETSDAAFMDDDVPFSLSFWAAATTNGLNKSAVALRQGANVNESCRIRPFDTSGGGGVEVFYQGGTTITGITGAPTNGRMHLITFTTNAASRHILYINGIQAALDSGSRPGITAPTNFTIGAWRPGQEEFHAWLSDVCLWSREITADEVWSLYDPQTRWDLYWQPKPQILGGVTGAPPVFAPIAGPIFATHDADQIETAGFADDAPIAERV